jgi:tRNA (adenine37-N6)-methyltransferase
VGAPVGRVRGGRAEAFDDDWGAVEATIELDGARFGPMWSPGSATSPTSRWSTCSTGSPRPPSRWVPATLRGNEAWPRVGIFAQRARARPDRIDASTCELVGVEGRGVRVPGLDAIDGTPVLDLKRYTAEFAPRGTIRHPAWATALMAGY